MAQFNRMQVESEECGLKHGYINRYHDAVTVVIMKSDNDIWIKLQLISYLLKYVYY